MNKELRYWVLGNMEVAALLVMLTIPLWIVPFCLYNIYVIIRDELRRAV
jgi:hypothetical protein